MGNFDSYKIAGSDSREHFGKANWKHNRPSRYNLPAHGISPEEADSRRDIVNYDTAELSSLSNKKHLSKNQKNKVKELERSLASNSDILNADKKYDTTQAAMGNEQYVEGKQDYFSASDSLKGL